MLENDLLDGETQFEQFGDALVAIVGHPQATLRTANQDAAQQQLLHGFARRHAADIESSRYLGFGDPFAGDLVAPGDGQDQALLDLVGGRAAALDRRKRRLGLRPSTNAPAGLSPACFFV